MYKEILLTGCISYGIFVVSLTCAAILIAAGKEPVQLSSGKFKCGKKKNIFPLSFINAVSKISEKRHGQI